MKILKIILILIPFFCTSQENKKIVVIDSKTNQPVDFCTIKFNNNGGTYSNSLGEFFLDTAFVKKIKISHISYDEEIIEKNRIDDTIRIHPKKINIPEIEISNKYSQSFKLIKTENSKEKNINTWHFQPKTEFILFLKPEKNEVGAILHQVSMPCSIKNKDESSNETIVFRLNIYDKNRILIYSKTKESNIEEVKNRWLNFILDEQLIFHEQGFFFGIEFIGKIDDNKFTPLKKGNSIALNFTSSKKNKNNSYYKNIFLDNGNWIPITKNSELFPFEIESNMNISLSIVVKQIK